MTTCFGQSKSFDMSKSQARNPGPRLTRKSAIQRATEENKSLVYNPNYDKFKPRENKSILAFDDYIS